MGNLRAWVWAVVASMGAGCATPAPESPPPTTPLTASREVSAEGPSPDPDPWIAKNCIEGMPTLAPNLQAEVRVIRRRGYVLAHSSTRKVALWVAEAIPRDQLDGPAERRDNFRVDPELPEAERSRDSDYAGSGFDRGHQAPAEDFTLDQELMDESFYLSNMAPQVGVGFNRHVWADLEAWARDVVRKRGIAWVITGPLFLEEEGRAIGAGRVAVPSHFYKVVVTRGEAEALEAIAFVLENRAHTAEERRDLARFIRAIDWVEEKGGLDVMPRLPPTEEERLERRAAEMWN
jgi:endonuclease G